MENIPKLHGSTMIAHSPERFYTSETPEIAAHLRKKFTVMPERGCALMSGKQLGFSDNGQSTAKKQTKRPKFLPEWEWEREWKPWFPGRH